MNDIMSVKDLANYLQYHEVTIYRMLSRGIIRGKRIGIGRGNWRFKKSEIDKMFRKNR